MVDLKLRQECNSILDNVLHLSISIAPELRYIQNLWAMSIVDSDKNAHVIDRFYEEPYDTIVRILPKIIGLINDRFPKNPTIINKLERTNIITGLTKLNLVTCTDDFKIIIK